MTVSRYITENLGKYYRGEDSLLPRRLKNKSLVIVKKAEGGHLSYIHHIQGGRERNV